MTTREALHLLIDELPDDQLDLAADRLARLKHREESWEWLQDAPIDDEPLSEREREALKRYDAGERSGRIYSEAELVDLIEAAARG